MEDVLILECSRPTLGSNITGAMSFKNQCCNNIIKVRVMEGGSTSGDYIITVGKGLVWCSDLITRSTE